MRREYSPLTIIKSLSSTSSFTSSMLSSASAASILSMCSLSYRGIELVTYRFPAVERRERRRTRVSPSSMFFKQFGGLVSRDKRNGTHTTSNKPKTRNHRNHRHAHAQVFGQCPSRFQGLHAFRKFCRILTKHLGPPWSGSKASHLCLHSEMTTLVLGKSFSHLCIVTAWTVDECV